MSTLTAQTYLTPEEYLTWERKQPFKNEYHNGQIIAMSGASRWHNRITVDTTVQLSNQLMESECEVFAGEMRVRTSPTVSYYYPDVIVVCGEPRFEDDTFDTLLNPIVVIEVLSPSTAAFDRGEKFEHYKQLASLQEYILISQDSVRVEHYQCEGSQWTHNRFQHLEDTLSLASIECEVPLRAIYRRVVFNTS
ncbi:MAG: Uma2 family endonuclease [Candidatus Poribacteria bacterium]|nr:Uma2 family endonuclease [Candidatus Poribacteria bacterium]